jgi:hypothetical protein
MAQIPNGDQAVFDVRKLADYCLDPAHPRGRHKARVFRDALNIGQRDAAWLRDILLAALRWETATELENDVFGERWRIDVPVTRQNKQAVVRTIWMVRSGENIPRFVTCWVL